MLVQFDAEHLRITEDNKPHANPRTTGVSKQSSEHGRITVPALMQTWAVDEV